MEDSSETSEAIRHRNTMLAVKDFGPVPGRIPDYDVFHGLRSQSPAPSLLYVCQELFQAASHFYAREFGPRDAFPYTWIAFERDTLYLDLNQEGRHLEPNFRHAVEFFDIAQSDAHEVKNLALFDKLGPAWVSENHEWSFLVLRGMAM